MNVVLTWIVFGALVGSLGTYLLYTDRRRDPEQGALIGAAAGAVGNLIALVPLWAYIYMQGRLPVKQTVVRNHLTFSPSVVREAQPTGPRIVIRPPQFLRRIRRVGIYCC